jgi:non-ribosomal peptide synthase protein (TIGR01720 family)
MMRLGLFKTTQGDHLLIALHHLVVDGISWRILSEDIAYAYQQCMENKEITFPDKTDSFKDWAIKLGEYAKSWSALKELDYWGALETAAVPALPFDFPLTEEHKQNQFITTLSTSLSETDTQLLLSKVNRAYNTEINDILLAALAMGFEQWCGAEQLIINLEGHGREDIVADLDVTRTVGWFTAQFPVLLSLAKSKDLGYRIKYIKETMRRIPNKGFGFGVLKYITPLELKESFRLDISPSVSFNYLGEFGQELKQEEQEDLFTMSPLPSGDSLSPRSRPLYHFNINGMVMAKKLSLTFSYNSRQYREETVQKLVDAYRECLSRVVAHCSEKETGETTPGDVTAYDVSLEDFAVIKNLFAPENTDIKSIYPLSPMQNGMLFHSQLDEESEAYFVQNFIRIQGTLDPKLLEESYNILIRRYDILRTAFVFRELETPMQVVLEKRDINVQYKELHHLESEEINRTLDSLKQEDRKRGFDLTHDPLIRVFLFKTGDNAFQLGWSYPHILMDGWCMGTVYGELVQVYQSLANGAPVPQMDPPPAYRDYIHWLDNQNRKEGINYWKKYLNGYSKAVTLNPQVQITPETGFKPGIHKFIIEASQAETISQMVQQASVTMNIFFLAVWGILIQKYNHTQDVVIGSLVSGRPSEVTGIEEMVGLFINTIPVRIDFNGIESFSQLLTDLQTRAAQSKPYEYLPLPDIQATTPLNRNLMDSILAFENYPVESAVKEASGGAGQSSFQVAEMELYEYSQYDSNYNFSVVIDPLGKALQVSFVYNSLIYQEEMVQMIQSHMNELINGVLETNDIQLSQLNISSDLIEAEDQGDSEDYTDFDL